MDLVCGSWSFGEKQLSWSDFPTDTNLLPVNKFVTGIDNKSSGRTAVTTSEPWVVGYLLQWNTVLVSMNGVNSRKSL